jgi:hypothetical protein
MIGHNEIRSATRQQKRLMKRLLWWASRWRWSTLLAAVLLTRWRQVNRKESHARHIHHRAG